MKLGISRPRNQEYRPRTIDAKATKAARTTHAAGVKRLADAVWGNVAPLTSHVPGPGMRTQQPSRAGHDRLRPSRSERRANGKAVRAARRANR